jgi:hypothetical protein
MHLFFATFLADSYNAIAFFAQYWFADERIATQGTMPYNTRLVLYNARIPDL